MKAFDYLEKKKIWFNGVYDDGKVKHHFICDLMDEYAQEFKIQNKHFVTNRFNWNHFFIGYFIGILLAMFIALIML